MKTIIALRLTVSEKKLIKQCFSEASEQVGPAEEDYVNLKIKSKLRILTKCSQRWAVQLNDVVVGIHSCIKDHERKKIHLSKDLKKKFIAALFYFVDPYDVIPDHVPERGYFDDLYVMALALKELKSKDIKLFETYFSDTKVEL